MTFSPLSYKCSRREKERSKNTDLYWFTLPQRLRAVLCQLAKSSTKEDHQDQFYTKHNTCNPQATTIPSSKQPIALYSSCSTNAKPTALNQLQLQILFKL